MGVDTNEPFASTSTSHVSREVVGTSRLREAVDVSREPTELE
jgi:hypothetical protein